MLSYFQVPDRTKVYVHPQVTPHFLVVKYYNDIEGMASWHLEDNKGTVYESDILELKDMEAMVENEGWILFKCLEKELFQ